MSITSVQAKCPPDGFLHFDSRNQKSLSQIVQSGARAAIPHDFTGVLSRVVPETRSDGLIVLAMDDKYVHVYNPGKLPVPPVGDTIDGYQICNVSVMDTIDPVPAPTPVSDPVDPPAPAPAPTESDNAATS